MGKALLAKIGNGQVEPNKISALHAGHKLISDIPVAEAAMTTLKNKVEQGQFLAVDITSSALTSNLKQAELRIPKANDTYYGMVYNEIHLYSDFTSNKDYAMYPQGSAPSVLVGSVSPYAPKGAKAVTDLKATVVPRVVPMTVGDTFTTNLIESNKDANTLPAVGTALKLNAEGILSEAGTISGFEAKVAQHTTMADGQKAVKVIVTKADALGGE